MKTMEGQMLDKERWKKFLGETNLSGTEIKVYLTLLSNTNENNEIIMEQYKLMYLCGCGTVTLYKSIGILKDLGLLEVLNKRHTKNSKYPVRAYKLNEI